jgi:hypothetical protein
MTWVYLILWSDADTRLIEIKKALLISVGFRVKAAHSILWCGSYNEGRFHYGFFIGRDIFDHDADLAGDLPQRMWKLGFSYHFNRAILKRSFTLGSLRSQS